MRTETTINNSRAFAIGRRLPNLPALRAIGFAANQMYFNAPWKKYLAGVLGARHLAISPC